MSPAEPAEPPIRAAEVVAALSLATDLGSGQPLEHALRTALLSVRLGELCGLNAGDLTDVYYTSLLHAAGCTSDGHEAALLFGDDISPRASFSLVDHGDPQAVLAYLQAHVGGGRSDVERAAMLQEALPQALPMARQVFAMHCEVAQQFAAWLGLSPGTGAALGHVFERWDGLGFPGTTSGEALPLASRVLHVARDVSIFLTTLGFDGVRSILAARSATAYDPALADVARSHLDELVASVDDTRLWEQAMDAEPPPRTWMAGGRVDDAFVAMATFVGLKSPWFRTHSTDVAELAEATAWRMGLPGAAVTKLRRAALCHDLGRVGVSNAIWEKPGPLGFGEWERVRLHPHYTERAFAQSSALAPIGRLAGAHHERLDGSGYHRGTRGSDLDVEVRILAAADAYTAMREERPYRPALQVEAAVEVLARDARHGRLDAEVVDALLAVAGSRSQVAISELPGGLTRRELQVLRLVARGDSNQEIADTLRISAKTVGHHVQHIYQKAGVRSRAAATVWAFQQGVAATK